MSKLFIIATPIGNLEDITLRARRLLGEIDVLACEDTRRTRILYEMCDITPPKTIFSYHDHNEERAGERIVKLLKQGRTVGLCTDGGMPSISDPGFRIVDQAYRAGIPVEVIPGVSAVTTALTAAGLPPSSFLFKGFPPRKPGPLKRFLEAEIECPHTLVIYESPFRLGRLLDTALEVYGNRPAAVCIELTKMYEAVDRDYLTILADRYRGKGLRGEVTLVIAGAGTKYKLPSTDGREGET